MLPFLPFTLEEQRALASEMLDKLASSDSISSSPSPHQLASHDIHEIIDSAVQDYLPSEGARSIRRAVQMFYEEKMEY